MIRRGKPEPNEPVHLIDMARIEEMGRRGMNPGFGPTADFHYNVICGYGSYHVNMTENPKEVTCTKCKATI